MGTVKMKSGFRNRLEGTDCRMCTVSAFFFFLILKTGLSPCMLMYEYLSQFLSYSPGKRLIGPA